MHDVGWYSTIVLGDNMVVGELYGVPMEGLIVNQHS